MCQLAAYVGDRPMAPLLLRAIELQEPYFGAHASCLGVIGGGEIRVEKDIGPVARVRKTTAVESLGGTAGVTHSRWGRGFYDPRYNTKRMAHPFVDCTGTLCLMHNGGISNYRDHWERLRERHRFTSYEAEVDDITDSEVAVHMLEDAVGEGLRIEEGLRRVASRLMGSFLLACISTAQPETVWIANWHQPCVVAVGEDEVMFCSSRIGFSESPRRVRQDLRAAEELAVEADQRTYRGMPLDPGRRAPDLMLDTNELCRLIVEVLGRKGEVDFRDLWYELNPDGWAHAFGITPEEWRGAEEEGRQHRQPLHQGPGHAHRRG